MPRPLVTAGFHHVALVVRELDSSIAFYRDLLGFAVTAERAVAPGEHADTVMSLADGAAGTLVTLTEMRDAPRGRYGVGGIHHHAFGTESTDTLLQWKRWLNSHGVATTGPLNRGYFMSLYLRDPDGQVLEIATRGPGYATDEPIDALGMRDTLPSESQLPGGRDEHAIAAATWPHPVAGIGGAMRLFGLHHVTGMTDDLGRAGEFYEAALGLRLVKRSVNQDDPGTLHYFWANYDGSRVLSGSSLTMFGWPGRAPHARAGTGQTRYIAFRAESVESLGEWREHLLVRGVDVTVVVVRGSMASISFDATDGLNMQLAANT